MQKWTETTAGKILAFTLCFCVLAGIYYWVVAEDWSRTSVTTEPVSAGRPVGMAGTAVEQTFVVPADSLETLQIMPEKATEDEGTVRVEILDGDRVLYFLPGGRPGPGAP